MDALQDRAIGWMIASPGKGDKRNGDMYIVEDRDDVRPWTLRRCPYDAIEMMWTPRDRRRHS
jgi:hypothetical protein